MQLLLEPAPNASVLKQRFETQVKTLKDTRGAESRTAREDRHQAIVELNNLCEQVIELSFDALAALGKQPPEYKAECPSLDCLPSVTKNTTSSSLGAMN